ncbi:MAG TPA: 4Fe-4S ferredoxin, partial [Candidatus Cloacimonas acidaminovorans]|nr:4Fe-4S ferredoxin [Candidatus Cloacimonas acidaminovorans]
MLIFLFYNAFLSFAMNKDDCSVTSIPQKESRQFNKHTLNSERQDKIPTPKKNEFSSTIRTQSQNIKTEPSSTQ